MNKKIDLSFFSRTRSNPVCLPCVSLTISTFIINHLRFSLLICVLSHRALCLGDLLHFLFRAKLRRCTAIFRKIKDRIITKAVRSRRLMRNPSLDRLPYYVYASVRKYSRYRTYESRSTLFIRNPFQTIQKNTVLIS